MIQDTINSIKVTLNDRFGSPFVSAYFLSSVLVNWKFFLLILSDLSYEDKLKNSSLLYPDEGVLASGFLFFPLLFGLFWTFIWPIINWGISGYWYSVKSYMINTRIRSERKRIISEKEAAEIYLKFDSQESKYLELLKDKQSRADSLIEENRRIASELERVHNEVIDRDASVRDLNAQVRDMSKRESESEDKLRILKSERDIANQDLKSILDNTLRVAEILPALKSFSISIDEAVNFRADEMWVKKRFLQIEGGFSEEDAIAMLELFISIGLFVREVDGYLIFGDRMKYQKARIIGMYDNSPGPTRADPTKI